MLCGIQYVASTSYLCIIAISTHSTKQSYKPLIGATNNCTRRPLIGTGNGKSAMLRDRRLSAFRATAPVMPSTFATLHKNNQTILNLYQNTAHILLYQCGVIEHYLWQHRCSNFNRNQWQLQHNVRILQIQVTIWIVRRKTAGADHLWISYSLIATQSSTLYCWLKG